MKDCPTAKSRLVSSAMTYLTHASASTAFGTLQAFGSPAGSLGAGYPFTHIDSWLRGKMEIVGLASLVEK